MKQLTPREGIEAAAAIIRSGKMPPWHVRERIVISLDATAVVAAMSEDPDWPYGARRRRDRGDHV